MTSVELGCDTQEMILVHRVFRRGFAELPGMIRSVVDGDVPRALRVAAYAHDLVDSLLTHQRAEEALMWPMLAQRASLPDSLTDRMDSQHQQAAELVDEILARLPDWASRADPAKSATLAELVEQLSGVLAEHLDDEEALVLPLVAEHLSAREWRAIGKQGRATLAKGRAPVLLAYILEDASPEERASFLAGVSVGSRMAYRLVGARRHRRESAELRG
jgi:hemerythrin-like domain-containing protein